MTNLIYSMGVSLDGFIAGPAGEIDWSVPDEELHRFHNDQTRELGAQLCGRGLYETMVYWETVHENPAAPEFELEFADIWQALPKVVFSRTLDAVVGNARLARDGPEAETRAAARGARRGPRGRWRRARGRVCPTRARRRVPAVRQPGRARRRHALLPSSRRADRAGVGRDADVRLARRLHALPAGLGAVVVGGGVARALVARRPNRAAVSSR